MQTVNIATVVFHVKFNMPGFVDGVVVVLLLLMVVVGILVCIMEAPRFCPTSIPLASEDNFLPTFTPNDIIDKVMQLCYTAGVWLN